MVGLELDAGTKVGKADSCSSSVCSSLIAAEFVVWLFELVGEVVVGPSFIVMCGLATVFI